MRILTDDFCPDCGGKLRLETTGIACFSCEFTKYDISPKNLERLRGASEEVVVNIELTLAGEWLVSHDLHDWFDMRRLAQNHQTGNELRALDKMLLLESGLGKKPEMEVQENG